MCRGLCLLRWNSNPGGVSQSTAKVCALVAGGRESSTVRW